MTISLIAAIADNGIIGTETGLPWRIKSEWQYFARMTKGKPLILGRKTFETLDAPLKDRSNIIVTRDKSYSRPGIEVATTLEEALALARKYPADEIMIGGGAEIYKLALPMADRLYLTEVHMQAAGTTSFPAFDRGAWKEIKREPHKAAPGEDADYTITVLERK